ncbi:MAG TPA: DEAD/DEAH box helicase [Mucilaginibacter sp.]
MAWPEKLKLSKQLVRSAIEAGYLTPTTIQLRSLSRIIGGQDVIVVGPEGCGKTTTYTLAVLNRLRYTSDGVPKVLILVPDKEQVLEVISGFELLGSNKQLLIVGLYAAPGSESQMNALADGADIVVATPDRARSIYLKLGLNLNKIDLLIIDDSEQIVKQGLQLPVAELANSITKCQHLVFTTVVHDKLNKMIAPFMKIPSTVEVEEMAENQLETHQQVLYHVLNFGTKLNLLNLFMQDDELFTKTVVFVNTHQTAEKIYKTLTNRRKTSVALLNSWSVEFNNCKETDNFKRSVEARILIIAGENNEHHDLTDIPFLIHFELPDDKQVFIERVIANKPSTDDETLAITFATDLELNVIRKIEQVIGQKIPVAELPEDLVIEKEKKKAEPEEKQPQKKSPVVPLAGEAFHQKKASNLKTYNYGAGTKAKMTNKKKH